MNAKFILLLTLLSNIPSFIAQPVSGTTSANGVTIIYQDGFNANSLQTTGSPFDVTKWQRTNAVITLNNAHNWAGTNKGYETGSTHMISFNAGGTGYYLWSPQINLPASNNLFARIALRYPSTENISGGGVLTLRLAIDTDNDLTPNGTTYSTVISGASNPYNDAATGSFFTNITHDVRYLFLDLSTFNSGGNTRIGIFIQNTASALLSPPVYLDWFELGTRPTNDICANAITLGNGINGGANGYYNTTASGLMPSTNSSPANNQGGSVIYIGPGANGTGSIPNDGTYKDGYEPSNPGPFGTVGQTVENSTWYKFMTPIDPAVCGQPTGSPISVKLTFSNLSCASTLANIPAEVQFRTFNSGLCGTNISPSALHLTQTVGNNGTYTISGLAYNTEYYLLVDGVFGNDCKYNITAETFINGVLQPNDPCVISLPIELSNFNVNLGENNIVQIDWDTKSERNNDYFLVERSIDGINFEAIQKVNGFHNTTESHHYSHLDLAPNIGLNYYRLTQVDFDGNRKTYPTHSVNLKNEDGFLIVPNPNQGKFTIFPSNLVHANTLVVVSDARGNIVYKENLVSSNKEMGLSINLNDLKSGIYFVSFQHEGKLIETKKLIIY